MTESMSLWGIADCEVNPAWRIGLGALAAALPAAGDLLGHEADWRAITYVIKP